MHQPLDCRKSFAEFFAEAKNKVKIIFGRGVYVDKNTSQAASVEFVCHRQTNSARSRLQKIGGKPRKGIFDKLAGVETHSGLAIWKTYLEIPASSIRAGILASQPRDMMCTPWQ